MLLSNQNERYAAVAVSSTEYSYSALDAASSYHDAIMDNPGRIKSIMFMSFNCGKTDTRFSIKL